MKARLFLALFLVLTHTARAADDAYFRWARGVFGVAATADSAQRASVWGENADPDGDGFANLIEYAADTNPLQPTVPSDVVSYSIDSMGFPQLTTLLRTDDPDLRVLCQIATLPGMWWPNSPENFSAPVPFNPFVSTTETGFVRGLRQMKYRDVVSIAGREKAFMRLRITRRDSTATTAGIDPVTFTAHSSVKAGSVVRSNTVVLGGFTGTVSVAIPPGVTLYVNGVAVSGSMGTVKAGDHLWMEAFAHATVGVPRNFDLGIGTTTARWTVTAAAPAAVADHPGTESGYTPVETGVSDTGAAQISIPIVVSPGTAGMQPKLAITYSSQGGNGPLGLGFSLSGLSAISRTGATLAQDGFKGGIAFDANDRFALDGQRLIAISGADGGDGTEYRLEFDPSTRIRSYGVEGSGPQRWVVETKAGLTMEFGAIANARVVAPSANRVGYLRNDIYTNIPGGLITDLLNSPKYPNSPDKTQFWPAMTSGYSGDNYGQRLRGWVTPKTSGLYQFSINSDDYSQLRFNSSGPSEAGSAVILNNPGTTTSPYYNLTAGVSYFIEALHKEGPGADYVYVYWTGPGVASGTVLAGDVLSPYDPTQPSPSIGISAWALSSVKDTAGNAYTVTYDATAAQRGELLVSRIAYTTNTAAGLTPNQEVVFEYEDRPDAQTLYIVGTEIQMLKRLQSIESRVTVAGIPHPVRRYFFSYGLSSLGGRSILTALHEQQPGQFSHTSTFDWMDAPLPNFSAVRPVDPIDLNKWSATYTEVGDFNGDGKSDFFSFGGDGKLTVRLREATASFQIVSTPTLNGFNPQLMWLGDFDADGLTDILTRPTGNTQFVMYFSNGDGTFRNTVFNQSQPWDAGRTVAGDFNGDGRTDVLSGVGTSTWKCFLSNGDGTFSAVVESTTWQWNGSTVLAGDFNGDGLIDLASHNYGNAAGQYAFIVKLSKGDGTFGAQQFWHYNVSFGNAHQDGVPPVTGDFNGDGIFDIMAIQGQFLKVFLFDGTGGVRPIISDMGVSGFSFRQDNIGNFNADRMTDMMSWINYSGQRDIVRFIAAGNGVMQMKRETNTIPWNTDEAWVGDFDGDGKADIVSAWDRRFTHFISGGSTEELITKVTNGHGGTASFAYKPLTDSGVYTKGTGLTYPYADLQASMYVVSSVTARNGIDGDAFTGAGAGTPGTNTVEYRYEGAWTCLDGRGFQGFKAVVTTDTTAGIVSRTEYESSSPLLGGRAKHSEQRLLPANVPVGGSALISDGDVTWDIAETTHPTGRKTYQITEATSVSRSYETNRPAGSALVKTTSRTGPASNGGKVKYDQYANLKESTTTTTDGAQTFTETVVNVYGDSPTPTKWHLGRLSTSTVTKTGPNPAGAGTVSLTRQSSFQYHPTTGLLTQEVIEPSGGLLRQQKDYTHDAFGNIETSTVSTAGEASRTTTTYYTPDGRFVRETRNAKNHGETKTHDPLLGNVLTQTGPNNLTTTWQYDALGRPILENRPDGTVTRSFYRRVTGSTVGAPPRAVHYVRVQSTGGAPKTVWYDLLDREIRADSVSFDGRTVSAHKVFDVKGQVSHASQPYFAGDAPLYSTMLYDAVGREYQQNDPGNRVTKTTHDGLTTTVERNYDPANLTAFQKAVTTVNAMGWTVSSSQFLGAAAKTVTRSYDPYGNLRFVTDPAGNTTELRYDVRGNKNWMSEPNSGTSSFTYNGFGELKTQTNSAGQTVTMSYDELGRVLTRTEPEGVTTFTYDSGPKAIGQLVAESSPGFSRVFYYDALARPAGSVETHGVHSFAVSRSYDVAGRPDAMTFPTGFGVRQSYTALGHLSMVQNAANPSHFYWAALQVNARGQVTQEVLGNGVVTDRAFEAETGVINGITSSFGVAGDVQKCAFGFDLIGNLATRQDLRAATMFEERFTYDSLNRLDFVTTKSGSTVLSSVDSDYNDIGNLTRRSDVGDFAYAGARPHALTGVTGGAFDKACAYDAKGNRTQDGATALDYSSFNKPVRIAKGGDTLRFDYGPDRSLFRQTTFRTDAAGATTQTVREYIGGLYERETTSEGLVRHIHYVAGGSGVVAIHTDERSAANAAQRTRFVHKDHLGSVDVLTDSSGAVVERQSFDAWGRRRTVAWTGSAWTVTYPATPAAGASAETHRGFTGHEMLDAVGLVHMGGRVYDPLTARFLSPDPFVQSPDNLQNLNRYSYVLNNPLSFTDPSGFFFKSVGKWLKNNWKQVVSVAVGIAISFVVPGSWTVFAQGFASGFGSAFSGTLLAGGSVGDALRAGLRGGAISGATAHALGGLSDKYKWSGKDFEGYSGARFAEKLAEKTIAHGFVGGTVEAIGGGKFVHGFMSSAAAAASSPVIYAQTHGISDALGVVAAATVGGTVSQIGGGKFANGAISGAMGYMFNSLGDDIQEVASSLGSSIVDTIGMEASQSLVDFSAGFFDAFGGEGWYQNNVVASGSGWVADTDSGFYTAGEGATLVVGGIGARGAGAGVKAYATGEPSNLLFGRVYQGVGRKGLLNSNNVLRIGRGYNGKTGQHVFRISRGRYDGKHHLDWPMRNQSRWWSE